MFETILSDLADSATPAYAPGPWYTIPAADGQIEVRAAGRTVAVVADPADARLIARSPELVAAARALITAVADQRDDISDPLVELLELCYEANGGAPSAD